MISPSSLGSLHLGLGNRNNRRRSLTSLILIIASLLALLPASAAAAVVPAPSIRLDGLYLFADVPPQIKDGRTFIPVRFLAESMGLTVTWLADQRVVLATPTDATPTGTMPTAARLSGAPPTAAPPSGALPDGPDLLPTLPPGAPADDQIHVRVAERWLNPDVPPFIENGRVMVPVRFVAEALGLQVDWDQASATVLLTSPQPDLSYRALLYNREPLAAWSVDMDRDGLRDVLAVLPSDDASSLQIQLLRGSPGGWREGAARTLPGFGQPDRVELLEGLGFKSLTAKLGPQVRLAQGDRNRMLVYEPSRAVWAEVNWWVFRPDRELSGKIPAVEDGGDRIVIVKGENLLFFFQNGVLSRVFPVASGRLQELTPEGVFRVAVKAVDPSWKNPEGRIIPGGTDENPLGRRWIGLSVNGDDGLHYGVHGTNAPLSIGTFASSGCVRMLNEQVEDLYDLVRIGTAVEIRP